MTYAHTTTQQVGSGNRFTQTYLTLKRDGVHFRGASGRADRLGAAGASGAFSERYESAYLSRGIGGSNRDRGSGSAASRLAVAAGLTGAGGAYDEDAEIAAAIASSLGATNDMSRGGSGGGAMEGLAAVAAGE